MCTSVVGIGLLGVWRLIDLEYRKSAEDLTSDVLRETYFQPEVHGYHLTGLKNGMLLWVLFDWILNNYNWYFRI